MGSEIIAVGVGGAIGAITRYYLSGWMMSRYPQFEPAGTLLVNVLGCFLIGLLVQYEIRYRPGGLWRAVVITGGLGSLTTFSTFGYQTVVLMRDKSMGLGIFNIAANLILGVLAVLLGLLLGRVLFR